MYSFVPQTVRCLPSSVLGSNISLAKPNVDILTPLSTVLSSPRIVDVVYKVQLPDPLVSIDNCSLYVDDIYNQTQFSPITKNSNYSFNIGSMSYGQYKLNVSCDANNTQSGFEIQY